MAVGCSVDHFAEIRYEGTTFFLYVQISVSYLQILIRSLNFVKISTITIEKEHCTFLFIGKLSNLRSDLLF